MLVIAGVTVYPSLRERYWIWTLESGTEVEQREAAANLVESKSVKAIPALIKATGAALDRTGRDWAVESTGSGLILLPIEWFLRSDDLLPNPWVFVEAIRQIREDCREPTERLLQRLLSDNRELVRAVAASVLFYGTDRAREYVSKERIVVVPQGIDRRY